MRLFQCRSVHAVKDRYTYCKCNCGTALEDAIYYFLEYPLYRKKEEQRKWTLNQQLIRLPTFPLTFNSFAHFTPWLNMAFPHNNSSCQNGFCSLCNSYITDILKHYIVSRTNGFKIYKFDMKCSTKYSIC